MAEQLEQDQVVVACNTCGDPLFVDSRIATAQEFVPCCQRCEMRIARKNKLRDGLRKASEKLGFRFGV